MSKKEIPIIVGVAQNTQDKNAIQPLDPLNLIAKECQNALIDTGVEDLRDFIDTIYMSTISSWIYQDSLGKLSEILDLSPKNKFKAPISGNVPQMLINKAAKAISLRMSKAVLIAGGEASYSKYRAEKGEIKLNWSEQPQRAINEAQKAISFYFSTFEYRNGLTNPSYAYALIETALRAASGKSLEEHLKSIGKLYERFSHIASKNPYAWIKKPINAEQIITPTSKNRKICHPYTKYMASNLYVDQAAALIMTTENIAKKLGINNKLWVYPMGGADLNNVFYMTQRSHIYDSPAIREATSIALEQAGLNLEDIDVFDLYSCFPCMVEIARQEIGIPEDDPRDLTITGGLSFFGGPFSSYSMHSIVTAVNLIREKPSLKVMILANGGYNTTQSIGIYGNEPPTKPWVNNDYQDLQQKINSKTLPEPLGKVNGNLTIEAYTIIYDRKGRPERGIVMGQIESGKRTLANIIAKSKTLLKLEKKELVGQTYKVEYDSNVKYNKILLGS
jgi:acetyl-CoA C-acetyltransferase